MFFLCLCRYGHWSGPVRKDLCCSLYVFLRRLTLRVRRCANSVNGSFGSRISAQLRISIQRHGQKFLHYIVSDYCGRLCIQTSLCSSLLIPPARASLHSYSYSFVGNSVGFLAFGLGKPESLSFCTGLIFAGFGAGELALYLKYPEFFE